MRCTPSLVTHAQCVARAGWQGEGAGLRGGRHVRYELLAKDVKVRKVEQRDRNDLGCSSGASRIPSVINQSALRFDADTLKTKNSCRI